MKARNLMCLVLLAALWLLPAARADLSPCLLQDFNWDSLPANIQYAEYCGIAALTPTSMSVEAPSSVRAWWIPSSAAQWWEPPDAYADQIYDTWSGSLLFMVFTEEFTASGGSVSFDYQVSFDGSGGYAEMGHFWEDFFPEEEETPSGFTPWIATSGNTSGHVEDVIPPFDFETSGFYRLRGVYLMAFAPPEVDPQISITNFQTLGGAEPIPEPATAWLLAGGLAVSGLKRVLKGERVN